MSPFISDRPLYLWRCPVNIHSLKLFLVVATVAIVSSATVPLDQVAVAATDC